MAAQHNEQESTNNPQTLPRGAKEDARNPEDNAITKRNSRSSPSFYRFKKLSHSLSGGDHDEQNSRTSSEKADQKKWWRSSGLRGKTSHDDSSATSNLSRPSADEAPNPNVPLSRRSIDAESKAGDASKVSNTLLSPSTSQRASIHGLDTDPAQIVNLALGLSERRRHETQSKDQTRQRSLAQSGSSSDLRQHYHQQQQRFRHRDSPQSAKSQLIWQASTHKHDRRAWSLPPAGTWTDSSHAANGILEISQDTQSRATRAKVAFELKYEYRRLLSILPPLAAKDHHLHSPDPTQGRPYNPLQYLRNRNVRRRERRPIDAIADEWDNVAKVRTWIDSIANAKKMGTDLATHKNTIQLPVFPTVRRSTNPQPRESHSVTAAAVDLRAIDEWAIEPCELLADVYWTCQRGNEKYIEDRQGRKTLTSHLGRAPAIGIKSKKVDVPPAQQHVAPPRQKATVPTIMTADSHGDGNDSKTKNDTHQHTRLRHLPRYAFRHHRHTSSDVSEDAALMRASPSHADRGQPSEEFGHRNQDFAPAQRLKTRKGLLGRPVGRPHSSPGEEAWNPVIPPRLSVDESYDGHKRMSSGDLDSIEPSSPSRNGGAPIIATSLSPPNSPVDVPRTPQSRLKSTRSRLRLVRSRSNTLQSDASDICRPGELHGTVGNFMKDTWSSYDVEPGESGIHASDNAGVRDSDIVTRPSMDPKNPILAQGERIAGLVGSHISRAGGRLRRRYGPHGQQGKGGFTTSDRAFDDSGIDDTEESTPESSPQDNPDLENDDRLGNADRYSRRGYHMENLPSFRHPTLGSDIGTDSSTQRIMNLADTQVGRQDRSTLPQLDTQSHDLIQSPRGMDQAANSTHQGHESGSPNRSLSRPRLRISSHDRLHNVLDLGNSGGKPGEPAQVDASRAMKNPQSEDKRQWGICNGRPDTMEMPAISKRDIARLRVLILCSGVKANEILRRLNSTPKSPSRLVQSVSAVVPKFVQPITMSQEHQRAAGCLIDEIDLSLRKVRQSEFDFQSIDAKRRLDECEAIESTISQRLSETVRKTVQAADLLNGELSTKHTLSVRQLNDSIDVLLRRRRGRARWLGRGGWAILEWALLAAMWLIWFLVVLFRLSRDVIRMGFRIARWLLWL